MKINWQRAAAYVVLVDNLDCILLTKLELQGHGMTGSWTLPGGGMEWGEQAIDTATRELFEETGLSADIGPLIGTTSEWIEAENSLRGQSGHSIKLLFTASNPTGELKRDFSDDDTTVDAAWFSLDEVRTLRRVPVVDIAFDLVTKSKQHNAQIDT